VQQVRVSAAFLAEVLANRPVLREKDVACRYAVSVRTIQRWVAEEIFPRPRYIRSIPFWTPADIAKFEAECALV